MVRREVAFILPGQVIRFPMHVAALQAYYECGLPQPVYAAGTSAGGLAMGSCIGWNEATFDHMGHIVGNLTPEDIFTLPTTMKAAALTLAGISATVASVALFGPRLARRSLWYRLGILGTSISALLGAEGVMLKAILDSESLLSNEPLRKLLLNNLDFYALFNSPTTFEILTTDMDKPGPQFFSNHELGKCDPTNAQHRKRFVEILLASAGLPVFPTRMVDGYRLADGEIWTDRPINHVVELGYKYIVVFDYWEPFRPATFPQGSMTNIYQSFDVMRDRNTKLKWEHYEDRRKRNPELPEIFHIRASDAELKRMPKIMLEKFKPADFQDAMNSGYRVMQENIPALMKYLNIH